MRVPGFAALADTDALLEKRAHTHGSFSSNADIAQRIKAILHEDAPKNDIHREALDMIASKIARILSGRSNFRDHWDDIAGYAKLASDACDLKE